jgi:4-amino-4-deoxy-L-arabinose transferase-like glycosyltransferase
VAAGLYLAAARALDGTTGLVRTVATNSPDGHVLDTRRVGAIDLDSVDTAAGGAAGIVVTWRGVWEVPADGLYDLTLDSAGPSTWSIDGHLAHRVAASGAVDRRTIWLASGFHPVEIRCDVNSSAARIGLAVAATGARAEPLAGAMVKPRLPNYPWLRGVARVLRYVFGWVTLVAFVLAVRSSVRTVRERFAERSWPWGERTRRVAAWGVLAVIVIHGALLRIDAVTGRYGAVTSPAWLTAVQTRSIAPPESIRPAHIQWEMQPLFPHRDGRSNRYYSDPNTYLDVARQMTWFYAGTVREPVFVFATRAFLKLLDNQDVAVSFASAFFSTLAIWLTYLLGASLWSRPVGLLAAAGLALDIDVVSLASLGWRDDAYMATLALCALLTLRAWRAGQVDARPVRLGPVSIDAMYVQAIVAGMAGGLAILTRITAATFVLPGLACLLLARRSPWRRSVTAAAIGLATAVVVAAPYYVNCWRVLGDPFYVFNVHSGVYSLAEGQPEFKGSTAAYIQHKFLQRPIRMFDTVAQGMTSYPFANKWHGLDHWLPWLGWWASIAAIAGLVVLAASAQGRLVLIMLAGSLVPFAFTWTVDPDYRFTEHAYPIFLIAAAIAVGVLGRVALATLVPGWRVREGAWPRVDWRPWAATVGGVVVVLGLVARVTPLRVFAESLAGREDATLTAGARDATVFTRGWSSLIRGDNVSMRVVTAEAAISFRLPDAGDYQATLRMDPFPRLVEDGASRLPEVELLLNGSPVTAIPLRWTPGRVGSYDFTLPHAAARRGVNELVLRVRRPASSEAVQPGLTSGDAVGVWYLRVRPPVS